MGAFRVKPDGGIMPFPCVLASSTALYGIIA